ncbi:MAG: NAD-dependent epimerase/dehydratase family protein [Acidimicrobiia bacterium]|nr:NAD-dependent epimerase/dehydratase family protein [Acidimicrobiia bacterium]
MRVLLTGGAGFIGSHIAAALRAAGDDVVIFDRAQVLDDAHSVIGAVTDLPALEAAVVGADAVCHQAAKVGLGVDFEDAIGYVSDNDLGTATVLTALHRARFRGPCVLASSMVVYGEGRYRCGEHAAVPAPPREAADLDAGRFEPRCPECGADLVPESVPESAPTDPRNVYAATKLAQEHLAFAFAREHPDVTVTALRYHNVYGPGMPRNTPYSGVSAIFADALGSGRAPRVFEDGGQIRDFVHVGDVAAANLLALRAGVPGAFNVASGEPRRLLDMADALADAFGPAAPRPEVVGGWRAGDVRHVFASPDRARDELGFVAKMPFDAGMRELAQVLGAPEHP